MYRRREEGEENANNEANRAVVRAVAEVTTVLTTHDHMELGTAMQWSIAEALSRIVRQRRSALPSM